MMLEEREGRVVVWAPAKLNLFLEVMGKQPDGYHELSTLFVAVSLYDTLVFESKPEGIMLSCDNAGLSTGDDNLIMKAAQLLASSAQVTKGASIHLCKQIPMEAGLAGGSSDAAATLLGLNQLWNLQLSRSVLADLAAELGSDTAFFHCGSHAAWGTGRGELLSPLTTPSPLWFVLVKPPFGLSTATVFKQLVLPTQPVAGAKIRAAFEQSDVEQIGRLLHNRLQETALEIRPEMAGIERQLALHLPAGYAMSGSGTCWFALCRNLSEAYRIAEALRLPSKDLADGLRVSVVRSCH